MEALENTYRAVVNAAVIRGIYDAGVVFPAPTAANAAGLPLGQFYNTLVGWKFPVGFAVGYYLVVTLWKKIIDICDIKPSEKSSPLFTCFVLSHNIFLTLFSFITFFNVAQRTALNFGGRAFKEALCDLDGAYWASGVGYFTWLFYLSKYYEVVDTLILLLKGRKPSFLQSYHHAGAILSLWVGIRNGANAIWIITLLNSGNYLRVRIMKGIHTIMYFYYSLATLSIKVPWKRALTTAQIVQFLVGCGIGIGYMFIPGCVKTNDSNKEYGLLDWMGHAFVLVYVIPLTWLFVGFARKTYAKKGGKGCEADGKDEEKLQGKSVSGSGVRARKQKIGKGKSPKKE